MSRFAALAPPAERRWLVAYLVACDPDLETTVAAMHALAAAGADALELGYPFSDPMAEGTVIQRAHQRALAAGGSLSATLQAVRAFRRDDADTPLALMGYANPLWQFGFERFADAAADAGADAALVVDAGETLVDSLSPTLQKAGLDMIQLAAPTTEAERRRKIIDAARGYLYYVSLRGTTGADTMDMDEVLENIAALKRDSQVPVCVGFGIKNAAAAAKLAEVADGVVVGSALIERAESSAAGEAPAAMAEALAPIRQALDAVVAGGGR